MKEKFYITTPIYYPSSKLTIGNCYTTIICDCIARYKKLQGYDVFYMTGTDEHGQKVFEAAQKAGKDVKEHLDEIVADTKELWKMLNVDYDKFIRTTDKEHVLAVQKIFNNHNKKVNTLNPVPVDVKLNSAYIPKLNKPSFSNEKLSVYTDLIASIIEAIQFPFECYYNIYT